MEYETVDNYERGTVHIFEEYRHTVVNDRAVTFSRTVCGLDLTITPVRSSSISDIDCINCLRTLEARVEAELQS